MRVNLRQLFTLAVCLTVTVSVRAQAPGTPVKPGELATQPATPPGAGFPTEIGGEGLESWIKKLKDPDASTRDKAVRVVPLFGPPAKKAIPIIISLMSDTDMAVRVSAMLVITTTPLNDPKQIVQVVQALNSSMNSAHGSVRYQAITGAARLGPQAQATTARLIDALGDYSSYQLRAAAADALGSVGRGTIPPQPDDPDTGPSPRAIHALLRAMGDQALLVRVEAVQSLIALGPPAMMADWEAEKRAVAARLQKEQDVSLKLWLRLLAARLEIAQEKVQLPLIAKELNNPKLQTAAAQALGTIGPMSAPYVNDLIAGLKNDSPDNLNHVAMCLWALGQIGSGAKPAETEVMRLTTHRDPVISAYAKDTLKSIRQVPMKK